MDRDNRSNRVLDRENQESDSKASYVKYPSEDAGETGSRRHSGIFEMEDESMSTADDDDESDKDDHDTCHDRTDHEVDSYDTNGSRQEEEDEQEEDSTLDSGTTKDADKESEQSTEELEDRSENALHPSLHGLLRRYLGIDITRRPGTVQIQSRWHSILSGLIDEQDEAKQLKTLEELGEILSMGTEETMVGFNLDQFIPPIICLLQQEHNPEVMTLACRCLANLIEALPLAASGLVRHGAVQILCSKLVSLEYIDLVEQILMILEKLSRDYYTTIVKYQGLSLALQYVDFFSSGMQRVCVNLAANLCRHLDLDATDQLRLALPSLINLMRYEESKIVTKSILALLNVVESLRGHEEIVREIGTDEVLAILISIIKTCRASSSEHLYTNALRLLKSMSQASLEIAKGLLRGDLPSVLKEALTWTEAPSTPQKDNFRPGSYGSPSLVSSYGSPSLLERLPMGSTNQLNELLTLVDSLLPRLPSSSPILLRDGEDGDTRVKNENIESDGLHESFVGLNDTSTNSIVLEDEVMKNFGFHLLPPLMETFASVINYTTRRECLLSILKCLRYSSASVLADILRKLPISNFAAGLLASKRLETIILGVQISEILIEKLPDIFYVCFSREGVLRELELLRSYGQLGERTSEDDTCDYQSISRFPIEIGEVKIYNSLEIRQWNRIVNSAARICEVYFDHKMTNRAGTVEQSAINRLKMISETLKTDILERDALQTLQELAFYFRDNLDAISVFELFEAGIMEGLANFLFGERRQLTGIQRISCFMRAFMMADPLSTSLSPQEHPIARLVSQLHEMLIKVDRIPICIHEVKENVNPTITSLRLLTQPLKLRLKREGPSEGLRDYSENIMLVDPLVSLKKIETFLLTRIVHGSTSPTDATLGPSDNPRPSYEWHTISRSSNLLENDLLPAEGFESLKDDLDFNSVLEDSYESHVHENRTEPHDQARVRLEFSYNDKPLSTDTLVFQIVYQHALQSSDTELPRFPWTSVHILTYRKKSLEPVENRPTLQETPMMDYLDRELCLRETNDTVDLHANILIDKYGKLLTFSERHEKQESFNEILRMLRFLHILNGLPFPLLPENTTFNVLDISTLSPSAFIDARLSAKLQRQLQDLLAVCTNSIPRVWFELVEQVPSIFPLKTRKNLLVASCFGLGRILTMLFRDILVSDSDHDDVPRLGRLRRQKIEIRRDQILTSAIVILNHHASSKSILEIQYIDEVGIGLGPTQEFFTLVAQEFQQRKLRLFHEPQTEMSPYQPFIFAPMGLYPRPLNPMDLDKPHSDASIQVRLFCVLGKFLARALIDSRLVTIQLSAAFWKLLFVGRNGLVFRDLETVDPYIYRTLCKLRRIISEQQLMGENSGSGVSRSGNSSSTAAITFEDVRIEDLCLEFTLPGYPDIELKANGSNLAVTGDNLEEYIRLVAETMLWTSVAPCVEAFRDGFNSVFPLENLRMFSFEELNLLLGGSMESWNDKGREIYIVYRKLHPKIFILSISVP